MYSRGKVPFKEVYLNALSTLATATTTSTVKGHVLHFRDSLFSSVSFLADTNPQGVGGKAYE